MSDYSRLNTIVCVNRIQELFKKFTYLNKTPCINKPLQKNQYLNYYLVLVVDSSVEDK